MYFERGIDFDRTRKVKPFPSPEENAMAPPEQPNPKVFISYSHDSPEHRQRVLTLAERLRDDGVDAQLDQYVSGTPQEGWPRWMLNQLDWANFVLVVCTDTYYHRFRGHEEPGRGKGVDWEGNIISVEIYNRKSRTTKFVPVLFNPQDETFIPEPLGGQNRYVLDSEESYDALYAFLVGQAGVLARKLGQLKTLPRKEVEPLRWVLRSKSDARGRCAWSWRLRYAGRCTRGRQTRGYDSGSSGGVSGGHHN